MEAPRPAVVAEAERIVDDVLGQELDAELERQLARATAATQGLRDLGTRLRGETLTAEQRVELGAIVHAVESVLELLEQP